MSAAGDKHKRVLSSSTASAQAHKKSRTDNGAESGMEDDISPSATDQNDESEFESAVSASEESAGEDDDYDSDSDRPKQRKRPTPKKSTSGTIATNGADVWREGVSAGLGPGKQVIIKKPKARSAGKIPYEDHTIHPNTFLFLADLKANNERQWLKSKCAISA